jgi:RNA recognition motif-containing protein
MPLLVGFVVGRFRFPGSLLEDGSRRPDGVTLLYIYSTILKSMAKKLFVGGLSWNTTEDTLREGFTKFGEISAAQIIFDKMSGRSKGFGFVEFADDAAADAAVAEMNGTEFDGRTITVNEARPMADRPPRRDFRR